MSGKKLTKGSNKVVWGVCSGIAEYTGLDVTIIRIAWALLTVFSALVGGLLVYVICGLLMPEKS
jgi:phage shock protein C